LGFARTRVGDDPIALSFGTLDFLARLRFRDELARDVRVTLRDVRAMLDELKRLTLLVGLIRGRERVARCLELLAGNSADERLARNFRDRLARLLDAVDSIR
jgi:hypothetical protein